MIFIDQMGSSQLLKNNSVPWRYTQTAQNKTATRKDKKFESDAADHHHRDTSFYRCDHQSAVLQHSTTNVSTKRSCISRQSPSCHLTDIMQLKVAHLLTLYRNQCEVHTGSDTVQSGRRVTSCLYFLSSRCYLNPEQGCDRIYRNVSKHLPTTSVHIQNTTIHKGTAVAQWLRCCATNRKVAGLIPVGVIGIFH